MTGHFSLSTNAYDLSVFDYALWSSLEGRLGYVPFMGQSIFSDHFMPVLLALLPIYTVFQSPVLLIVLQILAMATAGWLFYAFSSRVGLARAAALALLAVFLFSRRSHGAATSVFYPECLQAPLTFALVGTWHRRAWVYWTVVGLLLSTKEDAAIYVGAFASYQFFASRSTRPRALLTLLAAIVWFWLALAVAIPSSRRADGLPAANPLIESRFSSADGTLEPGLWIDRLVNVQTVRRFANLVTTTGLLPLAGGEWLLPAVPGILINLSARPDTMQAALTGHYAWPVLPWLFMASAAGAVALQRRSPRLAGVWCFLLVGATLVDSPAIRGIPRTRVNPDAVTVRRQLQTIDGDVILAQPNLIPHLPHARRVFALGAQHEPPEPDLVLVTAVGDLWPFSPGEVAVLVQRYQNDAKYEQLLHGPLQAFRIRSRGARYNSNPTASGNLAIPILR